VRWFSKKKPGVFLCIIEVGDTQSTRMVSSELVDQLVRGAKEPALAALDLHFGTQSWCSEIRTHTSMEGPTATFLLTITVPPGETQASMGDRVRREFAQRWDVAARRLL
jgi:hypothetical protein